jgi:hypothetical protein
VHGLGSMAFGLVVQKFLNIEGLLHWNCSWKFRRNWNVPLVLLERSWWAGFNRIDLVRFGFRMWEILILKWFLLLKIFEEIPKIQVLEGKINWGRGNTWAKMAQATLVWIKLHISFKHISFKRRKCLPIIVTCLQRRSCLSHLSIK